MPNETNVLNAIQASWHGFLDLYEPLRPDLYRYCRYLTRSPWDAEDLSQDALARAFATLNTLTQPPKSPKAWLLRIASNLWIDRVRRAREVVADDPIAPAEPRAVREAAGTLIGQLAPQERAAIVLKDVFDLSVQDVADALDTTPGAVKAALHRGREKLVAPVELEMASNTSRQPDPRVLDAFHDAFNARDLDQLTALLLDTSAVEVVGASTSHGAAAAREGALTGMLFGSERMADAERRGGMDPRFIQGVRPVPARVEIREVHGEHLLLSFYEHTDGEAVRAVTRLETQGDRVSRLRNYFFTPDFLAEVCRELGVPYRTNGYHYCMPKEEDA
ncbi:MAG: RNA polymerase sigma factor [Polyangiaceae bacterium]